MATDLDVINRIADGNWRRSEIQRILPYQKIAVRPERIAPARKICAFLSDQRNRYLDPNLERVGSFATMTTPVTSPFTVTCCGSKSKRFDDTAIVYIWPVGISEKSKYPKLLVKRVCTTPIASLIVTTLLETPSPDGVTTRPLTVALA